MRVLLAGVPGAIGMPLIRQLHAAGHDVIAVHKSPTAVTGWPRPGRRRSRWTSSTVQACCPRWAGSGPMR